MCRELLAEPMISIHQNYLPTHFKSLGTEIMMCQMPTSPSRKVFIREMFSEQITRSWAKHIDWPNQWLGENSKVSFWNISVIWVENFPTHCNALQWQGWINFGVGCCKVGNAAVVMAKRCPGGILHWLRSLLTHNSFPLAPPKKSSNDGKEVPKWHSALAAAIAYLSLNPHFLPPPLTPHKKSSNHLLREGSIWSNTIGNILKKQIVMNLVFPISYVPNSQKLNINFSKRLQSRPGVLANIIPSSVFSPYHLWMGCALWWWWKFFWLARGLFLPFLPITLPTLLMDGLAGVERGRSRKISGVLFPHRKCPLGWPHNTIW